MSDAPLYEIESHIGGKNAKVRVFPDRVEWERGKSVSGAKIAAGVMTAGLSFAATGARTRKGAGVEVIPMKSITSVTQKRDTMLNDVVSVITAGNTIDMRCSRKEAGELRRLILDGINGNLQQDAPEERPASPAPPPPPPPAGPPADWYPDPHGEVGLLRYWDGSTWTEHTHQQ